MAITAELGGRVLKVAVAQGDEVLPGQVLVELEQADLLAQQIQLEAAVATLKANLALLKAPVQAEAIALAEAQLQQAQAARDGANLVWAQTQSLLNNPHELNARLSQAQAQVTEAEKNVELAQVNLKRMEIQAEAASRNQSNNVGLAGAEAAQLQLQSAQQGTQLADVALIGAKNQLDHLVQLRNRPLALLAQANAAEASFYQAEALVDVAQANLRAIKAGASAEDMAIAQAQVQEAEAALAIVEVQLAKQNLLAPRQGIVSQKLINPGELAQPGAMLLELNDIETVYLSIYIPVTSLGAVKINQQAEVYVDAYPEETFRGYVSFIAPEAEYTPRNVQTQEERVNLVFAVQITLSNADHRLKPGMPADARLLDTLRPLKENEEDEAALPLQATAPEILPTALPVTEATPTSELRPTPSITTANTTETGGMRVEILSRGLKVRQGPWVSYESFAHVQQGQILTVLEVDAQTGWFKVTLPNQIQAGWISNNPAYVRIYSEQ